MNIKLFFAYKKISTVFLEAYNCRMGRYSNMNQSSRAATLNFVFLKAANNGSLKTNCCFASRARWNALAKHWPQGRKTVSLKFGLLDYFFFFFIFTNGGCTCFYEEKKYYRTRNPHQSQDGAFLEDLFAVCQETWVALDTANLVTFFAEVWQKCTNFLLVQPGPSLVSFVLPWEKYCFEA